MAGGRTLRRCASRFGRAGTVGGGAFRVFVIIKERAPAATYRQLLHDGAGAHELRVLPCHHRSVALVDSK